MRYSFYLSVSAILIITAFLGGCAVKKQECLKKRLTYITRQQ